MAIGPNWLVVCVCVWLAALTTANEQESGPPQGSTARTATPQSDSAKLYWIFLTTGKSTEGVKPALIQEMQKAHLENFKRLAEEEKLLTAGPMSDPDEKLRGIVVVKAKNRNELTGFFEDDPYVSQGYLRIEATEMEFEHGVINTKITPQGLEEFRLIVFEKSVGKRMKDDERSANEKFLSGMSVSKDLHLTVLLPKAEFNRTALMIMAKPEDDQAIEERLKELPAIKSGIWKSRIFPLYMGKGSLVTAG